MANFYLVSSKLYVVDSSPLSMTLFNYKMNSITKPILNCSFEILVIGMTGFVSRSREKDEPAFAPRYLGLEPLEK
jgi:hypothetical protein